MKIFEKIFWLVLGLPCLVFGQSAPTHYNSYDGKPVGGRALAMGQAFVALADDPYAVFWNPAGLSQLSRNIFGMSLDVGNQSNLDTEKFVRQEPLQGRKLTFLSFAAPEGAIFFRPLSNFQTHTDLGNDSWEENEIKIYALGLSITNVYGKDKNLLTGINLNYLNGRLAVAKKVADPLVKLSDGNGFSLDLGAIYQATPVLNLGISVNNFPGYLWWEGYNYDRLPVVFRSGIGVKLSSFVTFSSDYEKKFYRSPNPETKRSYHFGLEQSLLNTIFLRAGLYGEDLNDTDKLHYTFGIGYSYQNYNLDLALDKTRRNDSGKQSNFSNYGFSLSIPFGE